MRGGVLSGNKIILEMEWLGYPFEHDLNYWVDVLKIIMLPTYLYDVGRIWVMLYLLKWSGISTGSTKFKPS